jgi:putative ABC transport system permease protein
MNLVKISWANLRAKPLSSFLSGLLMTLGITIISLLLLLNKQLDEQFRRNVRGTDMVLGAKGSPLQLILSSVYQLDAPTGNIPLAEAERLTRNPMIKSAIPLAMGDNFKSFRIVGTNQQFLTHYGATLAEGRAFGANLEVIIGPNVATTTGLKVGDTFSGSHGLDAEGETHKQSPYKVVGVLTATNTVADQLILTNLSSIWAIHETGHAGETHTETESKGDADPDADREITSMLIKFRNPMGMMLARNINANSNLQAALPNIEINRLFSLLGVGVETLQALALAIIIIAGISVFVSLYNSLKDRRYEMALMLSMGATRGQLFAMLLLEGLALALLGFVLGLILSRLGLLALSGSLASQYHYRLTDVAILPEEWLVLGAAILIGLLAAALPSTRIYRMNISQTLAEE